MSLLNSRINSIEAEILGIAGGKADVLFPNFQGTSTFNGPVVLQDGVAFNSTSSITGLTNATVGLDKVQNIDAAAYTDNKIKLLTDGAPALLDTITELATAINNNPNYAIDIATNLTNINNNLLNRTQQYYFNSGTLSSNSPTYVKIGTLSNIQESVQHIKITITLSETNQKK
jgi:hypothetical protein